MHSLHAEILENGTLDFPTKVENYELIGFILFLPILYSEVKIAAIVMQIIEFNNGMAG